MSRNRPNYKSTSTKTITEVIKFSHLSPYNSGSPIKSRGIANQQIQAKIVVIQHNKSHVTSISQVIHYTLEFNIVITTYVEK
jgi:hypothetical protein